MKVRGAGLIGVTAGFGMYLAALEAEKHEKELMKQQTLEYAEYIEKLIEYADIMEKSFYVVVTNQIL